jgi:hypothetical protein
VILLESGAFLYNNEKTGDSAAPPFLAWELMVVSDQLHITVALPTAFIWYEANRIPVSVWRREKSFTAGKVRKTMAYRNQVSLMQLCLNIFPEVA